MPLNLDKYQRLAATTAIYPEDKALEYLTSGLTGEVGELMSKVAKWYRKDNAYPHTAVLDELGDILWFVSELARVHNCELSVLTTNSGSGNELKLRSSTKGNLGS